MSDTSIRLPIAGGLAASRAKDVKRAAGWIGTVGACFGSVVAVHAQATEIAHVAPFLTPIGKPKAGSDTLPDGRDPSW